MTIGFYRNYTDEIWDLYFSSLYETLKEHVVDILEVHNIADAKCCNVLFLWMYGNHEENYWFEHLHKMQEHPVLIYVQTEQISNNPEYLERFLHAVQFVDVIASHAPEAVSFIEQVTKKPVVRLPLFSFPSFSRDVPNEFSLKGTYDVLRLDSPTPYRNAFDKALEEMGLKVWTAHTYDIDKIAELVKSAKICLTSNSWGKDCFPPYFRFLQLFFPNEGFVLAQRNETSLLTEGEHIAYFDNPEDMQEKIRYYLEHEHERNTIAQNAYRHTLKFNQVLTFDNFIGDLEKLHSIFRYGTLKPTSSDINSKIVFTAIYDGYDDLKDPTVVTEGWEYICYTDNPYLKSNIWQIIVKEPRELDIMRTHKHIRLSPHTLFPGHELAIWVDASMQINCNLNWLVYSYLEEDKDLAVIFHPFRKCPYEEAKEVIRLGRENAEIIEAQMNYYKSFGLPENRHLIACGIIISRNTKTVNEFFDAWFKEVLNWSLWDQLSFAFVQMKYPLKYSIIPWNILDAKIKIYPHLKQGHKHTNGAYGNMRWDIINHLIRTKGYKKYLEIGIYDGSCFEKVIAPYKVGVDPEPKSKATIHKSSDEFFEQNSEKFDIIFIDGLHHADQVYRDIKNAQSCLNVGGTIVLHDCNPTEKEWQEVPQNGRQVWTGNVWKAFVSYRLDTFSKMYVIDTDYGIGIISGGITVEENFSTGDIPLTYENLEKNRLYWLNLKSLDEFYGLPEGSSKGYKPLMVSKPKYEWAILIPTIPSRKNMLKNLHAALRKQIEQNNLKDKVKVVILSDNEKMSIGAKRNKLLEMANSKYVSFIDDDDTVSADYVFRLYDLLKEEPDAIEFYATFKNGETRLPITFSHKIKDYQQDSSGFYRPIGHLNVINRTIAMQIGFDDTSNGEDRKFSETLAKRGLLEKIEKADDFLYLYRFNITGNHSNKKRKEAVK